MSYAINDIEEVPAVPAKKVLSVDGKDVATAERVYGYTYKWDVTLHGANMNLNFKTPESLEMFFNWAGGLAGKPEPVRINNAAELDQAAIGSEWVSGATWGPEGTYRRLLGGGWEYTGQFIGPSPLPYGPILSAYPLIPR